MCLCLQNICFAEAVNIFNITKAATETIVTAVEGCQEGFEKGRKSQGTWKGSKDDKLLSLLVCACLFDLKRKFTSEDVARSQTCVDDATTKVANSTAGVQYRLNNIFDKNEYSVAAIMTAFYGCEDTESKSKVHNWPKKFGQKSLYCSCVADYLQDQKNGDLTRYAEGKLKLSSMVENKCVSLAKTRK